MWSSSIVLTIRCESDVEDVLVLDVDGDHAPPFEGAKFSVGEDDDLARIPPPEEKQPVTVGTAATDRDPACHSVSRKGGGGFIAIGGHQKLKSQGSTPSIRSTVVEILVVQTAPGTLKFASRSMWSPTSLCTS